MPPLPPITLAFVPELDREPNVPDVGYPGSKNQTIRRQSWTSCRVVLRRQAKPYGIARHKPTGMPYIMVIGTASG